MSASRAISWWDTLRLQCFVMFPAALWGVVAPDRRLVPLIVRLNLARRTSDFLSELRDRYGCEHLWVWTPFRRTLLVLDSLSIDALLYSDANSADPWLKKRALSRFVPDGVIVSSGDAWRERRAFNESMLALGRPHPHRELYARIATAEAERLLAHNHEVLGWADFQVLAERVAHQILLGPGCVVPSASADLARLSGWANMLLRNVPAFRSFHAWLARELVGRTGARGEPRGLVDDAAHCVASGALGSDTGVSSQVGFWFFVLKDALELHVGRTLALLAAHPLALERACAEARTAGDPTPETIDAQHFLEACLLEQLRLWTPVPLLLRRTTRDFALRGAIALAAGEQVLVHAAFHHRDPRQFAERADRFMPEAVADGPPLLVFSRHRQSCAGETLVRFVLKAVLSALLARGRFTLVQPALNQSRLPLQINHFALRLRVQHGAPADADK